MELFAVPHHEGWVLRIELRNVRFRKRGTRLAPTVFMFGSDVTTVTDTPLRFFASKSSVSTPTQLSISRIDALARATSLSTSEQASHSCPS